MTQLGFPTGQEQENKENSQLATVVLLFISLRIFTILFLTLGSPLYAYSDFSFYYETAQLSQRGFFPFVNMWYEYPPLLAYLPHLAFASAKGIVSAGWVPLNLQYDLFSRLLAGILLGADSGVLILLHRIGRRAWGMEKANWIAWVYSGLALPFAMIFYAHQIFDVFFLLLALDLFMRKKYVLSGAALGLAISAKLVPAFFIAPGLKFLWKTKRYAAFFLISALIAVLVIYLPFLLQGGSKWVGASFQALARSGSYATLWAIIDGNWGPGYFGPLETRLQLSQALVLRSHAPVISPWLVDVIFGGLYAWLFFQPLNSSSSRHLLWFSTLTLLVFHLWSKGWSPQWALSIIPFLLLSSPNGRGLAAVFALSLLATTHWPGLPGMIAFFIIARTALFVLLVGWMLRQLYLRRLRS
jgi:hypothetical protein